MDRIEQGPIVTCSVVVVVVVVVVVAVVAVVVVVVVLVWPARPNFVSSWR